MGTNNYSPIDDLLKKGRFSSSATLKESEPVLQTTESVRFGEDEEHQIDEEVKPYVEIKSQSIKLPPDLKKLGVQPAGSSSSSSQAYQNVKIPISDDRVLVGLHAPINSSFRWLATLAMYILRRAHLELKKVHGRVIRIIKK